MKKFTKSELALFDKVFRSSDEELKVFLHQELSTYYKEVIFNKDFILAVGDIRVGLVAHMDTVFHTNRKTIEIYHDKDKNVLWSPQGLGADDRAGVFSILKLIRMGFRPSIIFTDKEEQGCIGAYSLTTVYQDCFADLDFLIELDRRGSDDAVFYDCDNPDFENFILSYPFAEAIGSYSDISVLCEYWGIAGVNFSIGYYGEHTVSETLNVNEMFTTISSVAKILEKVKSLETPVKYKYIPTVKTYNYRKSWNFDYECCICGEISMPNNLVKVKFNGKNGVEEQSYCKACYNYFFSKCTNCNKAFASDGGTLCNQCKQLLI